MKTIYFFLLLVGFLFSSVTAHAQANFAAIHNTDKLLLFSTTNEITRYFESNRISIVTYPLKRHAGDYHWVAAFPYSGSDTIDLYCFRHHGPQWRIQMVYFALSPDTRNLTLIERAGEFVIKDGNRQLITYSVKKGTKK